jgi:3-carboxy-cis,cis-muconate cycloisomerase
VTVLALEHPQLGALLGDPETAVLFSWPTECAALLAFETALARAQAASGVISGAAADAIATAAATFDPDPAALTSGTARDGVVVPTFVRLLKEAVGPAHAADVHKGGTSQDVADTALMLRLADALRIFDRRLVELMDELGRRIAADGARPLMGRTRMQRALPVTVGHRLSQWTAGFQDARAMLREVQTRTLVVQLGGAVGTRADYGAHVAAIERRMAADLGLGVAGASWQSTRSRIVDVGTLCTRISGAAGKLGQDVVLMAQTELGEAELLVAGGSSAMAHKRNPVKAEVLVSLARFSAGLVGTLHQALVHEQERSGAAWTLEWLVLPQLVVTAGASLRLTGEVLAETRF